MTVNEKQKGITLIALVITIIVMLVLAGVSINAIVGENGILSKAQSAKFLSEESAWIENAEMIATQVVMDRDQIEKLTEEEIASANR